MDFRKHVLTFIITTFICVALAVEKADSAELTPEQARDVWMVAWGATHDLHGGDRELLDTPPVLKIAPGPVLCVLYTLPPDCGTLLGLTMPGGETVFLNEEIDFATLWGASILFHEYVHSIQHRVFGVAKDCDQSNRYERDARWRQAQLLIKANRPDLADLVLETYVPLVCI